MKRGKIKHWIVGTMALALILTFSPGAAQMGDQPAATDTTTSPATSSPAGDTGDVKETYVIPDLESMNLIWVQEGNVLRVGYVVQTGDTMWDIARRYLNSPYYWPKIWERNSAVVINPHLIFPGDVLYLYPEVLVTRRVSQVEQPEAPEQVAQKTEIRWQKMGSTGFISVEELEAAGKIVDSLDHKVLLGDHDTVYVDVGKLGRKEPGDKFSIFRMLKDNVTGDVVKVRDPKTKELIGYQIVNLGVLQLTQVDADVSQAEILVSFVEIQNGDLILPYLQPLEEVVEVVDTSEDIVRGTVIASKNNTQLIGQHDIIYLDVGSNDKVMRGNYFYIYEPCEVIPDGLNSDNVRIPEKIIGHAVVLEALETTSVALVTDVTKEFSVGEDVLMSRYNRWEIEGVSQDYDVSSCRADPKCLLITKEEHDQGEESPFCKVVRSDEGESQPTEKPTLKERLGIKDRDEGSENP